MLKIIIHFIAVLSKGFISHKQIIRGNIVKSKYNVSGNIHNLGQYHLQVSSFYSNGTYRI